VKHGFLPIASDDWGKLVDHSLTMSTPDVRCTVKIASRIRD
jgi:hypothetical protein